GGGDAVEGDGDVIAGGLAGGVNFEDGAAVVAVEWRAGDIDIAGAFAAAGDSGGEERVDQVVAIGGHVDGVAAIGGDGAGGAVIVIGDFEIVGADGDDPEPDVHGEAARFGAGGGESDFAFD